MKKALITTTIYVPKVLERYRSFDKEIMFFVAGDRKTPHQETRRFVEGLGNAVYYSDEDQEKLGYKSSEVIGWNKIMRRNIALLEAIKHGAEIIVTIDDDNIPLDKDYFNNFISLLSQPFRGIEVDSADKWFNVGEYLIPKVYHRGFPVELMHKEPDYKLASVADRKIGVAAGMWFGDPDISAMERLVKRPLVHQFSEVLKKGLILEKNNFGPFDSQNTAYLRELAPLMMVLVGVGRYDDIWASYIAERVMMTTNYHVHFGKPFVWQERNPQNLLKNLKDEVLGMEFSLQFCKDLMEIDLRLGTVLEKLEKIYEHLKNKEYLPPVVYELGRAWCEDIKKIL